MRAEQELHCKTCHLAHNLWICMVCGHIGCGRYTEEHANRHFHLFRHSYRYVPYSVFTRGCISWRLLLQRGMLHVECKQFFSIACPRSMLSMAELSLHEFLHEQIAGSTQFRVGQQCTLLSMLRSVTDSMVQGKRAVCPLRGQLCLQAKAKGIHHQT